MKNLATLFIALSFLVSAQADPEGRSALVNELTHLMGVDETVRDAKTAMRHQADEMTEQMFNQLTASVPGLPKQAMDDMRGAADRMIQKVQESWSADEAIGIWQNDFMADFSDQDLRDMIAAAKTPVGKKQMQASKRANNGLQKFIVDRAKAALATGVKEYVAELQRIATEAMAPAKDTK